MKKIYQSPQIEIVPCDPSDLMTLSFNGNGDAVMEYDVGGGDIEIYE